MTWLEMAKEQGRDVYVVKSRCPKEIFQAIDAPDIDRATAVIAYVEQYATGCRGITCKECWAQEASNLPNNQKG